MHRQAEFLGVSLLVSMLAGLPLGVQAEGVDGPLYHSPNPDAPHIRVDGVTRGMTRGLGGGSSIPRLVSLVPQDLAYSASEQPTLYWFISDPYPANVEISITQDGSIEPVLEADLGPADKAGIHALSLADRGISLDTGVEYNWYVTLVLDPNARSQDLGAGSSLIVTPLIRSMNETNPLERGIALASAGLWYDAMDVINRGIESQPGNFELTAARAALLDEVDLSFVAEMVE